MILLALTIASFLFLCGVFGAMLGVFLGVIVGVWREIIKPLLKFTFKKLEEFFIWLSIKIDDLNIRIKKHNDKKQ